MKKKIIIDIGTHKAEELNLLFLRNIKNFQFYFLWWVKFFFFIIKLFFKKDLKFNQYGYSLSPIEINLKKHLRILKFLYSFRDTNIQIICIEPNYRILLNNLTILKKKLNIINLPILINDNTLHRNIFLSKFHTYSNTLSNSIYKKNNVDGEIENILSLNTQSFLELMFNENLIDKNSEIILRINCEGQEYSIIKQFIIKKIKLKFILGSLNDIKKIHGKKIFEETLDLIKENEIKYEYFKGSDPSTWLKTIEILSNYLKNG